ncbi:MAG: biotin--[acetyl-CoA-carboxylase] ligase [Elusimicrobiota bacterium]
MKTTQFPGIVDVKRLKTTVSTQNLARRLAEKDAPAWTLVWADRQSRGRGRLQRHWSSGGGGLYFSVILRPKLKPEKLAQLSLKCGRICAKALRAVTKLNIRIKPPNDILARATEGPAVYKKICGILIEASGCVHAVDWVVIGIGVNVENHIPPSLPQAASIRELSGRRIKREAILDALLQALRTSLK